METSILISIKKLLGIGSDDDSFDTDIIIHINSALMALYQIGIGSAPFHITGTTEVWEDFLGDDYNLEMAKSYTYMKVKLIFDPPSASSAVEAMKHSIAEFEWRLNSCVEMSGDADE